MLIKWVSSFCPNNLVNNEYSTTWTCIFKGRDSTTRAVDAEKKVKDICAVNEDLILRMKEQQGSHDAAILSVETALHEREVQLVKKEKECEDFEESNKHLREELKSVQEALKKLEIDSAGEKVKV